MKTNFWTVEKIQLAIKFFKEGKTYKEIAELIGTTTKAVGNRIRKEGFFIEKRINIKICKCCNKEFKGAGIKYCSRSCAGKVNSTGIRRHGFEPGGCIVCGKKKSHHSLKYCSRECNIFKNKLDIKLRIESGDKSVSSEQYKKYLINLKGNKCEQCGWCKTNPVTGNVPIELEHIDGDSENNILENLKLLCPNCHSLTPTYKALNIGKGRKNRYNHK